MDSIYSSMLLVPGVVALLNTQSITLRTTLRSQPSQLAKQPSDSHKMPKSMCSWRHLWRHYPCPWARVKRCWIAQHDCASLWWLSPRDRGGLAWIITWREGFDGASGGRGVWLRKPPVNQNLKEICDVFLKVCLFNRMWFTASECAGWYSTRNEAFNTADTVMSCLPILYLWAFK